jgi:hypothetical protein
MTGEITMLQTVAVVSPGDPDHRKRNQDPPRRPRPAPQSAQPAAVDDLGFDENDPAGRPRIGLLINVRA